MTAQKKFQDLLVEYNEAYRKGEPIVSDSEYNKLFNQYCEQYPDSLDFINSLGGVREVDQERKEKLPTKMTSLDKCKSIKELQDWVQKMFSTLDIEVVITPKYDGISLLVDEVDSKCWTKGVVAEQEGQRSHKHFRAMGVVGNAMSLFTVGEAIMNRKLFNSLYSKEAGGKYTHPRNMVAGLFNSNISDEKILRGVDYIRYGHPREMQTIDKEKELNRLNSHFYETPVYYTTLNLSEITEEKLHQIYYTWKKTLEWDIDGLVIDINEAKFRRQCSDMSSGNVGYAVAYKHPSWAERVVTKLKDIELKVSKQGKLKPVAILEPVVIDGVTIRRVTVNNMSTVLNLFLYPGCEVGIKRSGEVIPKIVSVHNYDVPQRDEIPDDKEFQIEWQKMVNHLEPLSNLDEVGYFWNGFSTCPCCNSLAVWDDTNTELICENENCPDKMIAKMVYFFETVGIKEFGEPSIRRLCELGYQTIDDLLKITFEELIETVGWGEVSAAKLLLQFESLKRRGVPAAKLLTALDLFEGKIGEKTCQLIFDSINIDELLEFHLENQDRILLELVEIPGIEDVTAKIFLEGWKDYLRIILMFSLHVSYFESPQIETVSDLMKDEVVCFTGVRDKDLEKWIVENGGKISDGVTKNTTLLIVKDMSSSSSKMKKAMDMGIKVMTLDTFITIG